MEQYEAARQKYLTAVERALADFLAQSAGSSPSADCTFLQGAMAYSLQNGGKRIRPVLTLAFCQACGADAPDALRFACAVEMAHTYSLIHDDLPAMDDDDFRRGKPASHKQFGEATAILAGDALLTLAFETLLGETQLPARTVNRAGVLLARALGFCGMVAGQVMDLGNERRQADEARLRETHLHKTGALIEAACVLGCMAAGASQLQCAQARQYAGALGLAFQIRDDILDVCADPALLGKPVGSDSAMQKSTYVSLLGLQGAAAQVEKHTQEAIAALVDFPQREFLTQLALELAQRNK